MTLSRHDETSAPSVSALDATSLPRHRWYFFKEAFSPEIVQHAMKETSCAGEDLVVDPFSGSGTTALEAARKRVNARGSEVNPFLAFVARAKLTTPPKLLLETAAENMVRAARKGARSSLQGFSTFTRVEGLKKWLFNDTVLSAFTGAWNASARVPTHGRSVVRLALLAAAMDTCNAVRDGKCLRYRADWQKSMFDGDDFLTAFEDRIETMIADVASTPIEAGRASIRLADSRYGGVAGARRFKLCVTSPPYLNSFDYTDVYRPELFLGGFVKDMKDLRRLRLSSIRSHVQVKWSDPAEQAFGSHFTKAYDSISERAKKLWNRRIPAMLKAYFEDMQHVLRSLRTDAQDDASIWIVVSTSAYAGVEVPVDLILADVGCQVGWSLREVRTLRHLRRLPVQQWDELTAAARDKLHSKERSHDGPHLRESLIILDASSRKSPTPAR
jgi:hypothetical protein